MNFFVWEPRPQPATTNMPATTMAAAPLGVVDSGQCDVPASAKHSVIAIAAGDSHSLALKPGR